MGTQHEPPQRIENNYMAQHDYDTNLPWSGCCCWRERLIQSPDRAPTQIRLPRKT